MMLVISFLLRSWQVAAPAFSGLISGEADLNEANALEQELSVFRNNPVFLGTGDLSRLADLPGLPANLIESLRAYTRVFGPPHDFEELAAVESVGRSVAELLNPFLRYPGSGRDSRSDYGGEGRGPTTHRSGRVQETRPRLTIAASVKRLVETRRGFENRREGHPGEAFMGGPIAHRSRLELRLGRHVTARLATDHDAGEAFTFEPGTRSYGPDFVGSSIQIVDFGPVKKLVIGDFTIRLGHGLTVWTGVRRSGAGRDRPERARLTGFTAKTGTSEIGYLRGVAARIGFGDLGTVEVFTAKMRGIGTQDTGLHRIAREIERRGVSSGVLQGGLVVMGGRRVTIGLVGTRINVSSDTTRSQFAVGVIGVVHAGWAHASMEIGRRTNRPLSWILSTYFQPRPWIEIGTRVRRQLGTGRDAQSVLAADGGGAGGANPGWLTTLTLRKKAWRLHAFRDYVVGSSITATRWRPEIRITTGIEVKTRIQTLRVRAVLVRDARDQTILIGNGDAVVRGLRTETTTRSKLQFDIKIFEALAIRVAIVFRHSRSDGMGAAIFHEIRWKPRSTLDLAIGVMAFEAARGAPIYAFEPDVDLQYTWSRLDGGGSRAFALFRLAPQRGIDLRIKIGQTVYETERVFGSGLDYIQTDRLTTVTASIQVSV